MDGSSGDLSEAALDGLHQRCCDSTFVLGIIGWVVSLKFSTMLSVRGLPGEMKSERYENVAYMHGCRGINSRIGQTGQNALASSGQITDAHRNQNSTHGRHRHFAYQLAEIVRVSWGQYQLCL